MAIYQRGNNWYIDFTFHGQRIREMIGPSRKGAEKVIAKRKAEIAENKFLDKRKDPAPVKFYDFAKEYLQWAKTNKKPSTYKNEICMMRNLDKAFEGKTIQEITAWHIEQWKSKRKEEVKPATVNRELALLKHFYTKAVEWRKCQENPAKKVKLFKGVTKRLRYLVPEEVQSLLSNCAEHIRPIVTVAVHTGMRKSEILGLRRDQVNFDQEIITLTDTKNHETRNVPMNETVKSTLQAIEGEGPFFFGSSRKKGSPYVWIEKSFHNALKKSGIEDFHFHDLRHTFASNLVMAGEDLNTVGELLGHKTPAMTKRYAHLSPKFKKRAVNVLDSLMSQNPPQEKIKEAKVLEFRRK